MCVVYINTSQYTWNSKLMPMSGNQISSSKYHPVSGFLTDADFLAFHATSRYIKKKKKKKERKEKKRKANSDTLQICCPAISLYSLITM
jgi:hypothetical protein